MPIHSGSKVCSSTAEKREEKPIEGDLKILKYIVSKGKKKKESILHRLHPDFERQRQRPVQRSQPFLSRKVIYLVNFCFYYLKAQPKQQLYEIYTRVFISEQAVWEQKKGKPSGCWLCHEGRRKWVPTPKTNTNSGSAGHSPPYPECCGHHPPLPSQTRPAAPDSARAMRPPAHPPVYQGSKRKGYLSQDGPQNVPTPVPPSLLNKQSKQAPPVVCRVLLHPKIWVMQSPQGKETAGLIIPNFRLKLTGTR